MTESAKTVTSHSRSSIPSLSIAEMRYFVEVYDARNFSRAARRLHMSQPPLSQAISALEKRLEVLLFERSTREVVPTAASDAIYDEVSSILQRIERIPALAHREVGNKDSRVIRLGAITSAFTALLPAILKEGLPFDVNATDLPSAKIVEEIVNGRLDVGLIRETPQQSVDSEILLRERLFVALPESHPLTEHEDLSVEEIANLPIVLFDRHRASAAFDSIVGSFRIADVTARPVAYVGSEQAAIGLVRAGLGLAIVPEIVTWAPWIDIAFRPIRDPSISYPLRIVTALKDPSRLQDTIRAVSARAFSQINATETTQ